MVRRLWLCAAMLGAGCGAAQRPPPTTATTAKQEFEQVEELIYLQQMERDRTGSPARGGQLQ